MFNNYVLSYLHSWVGWQFAGSLRALFLLQTVRALKRRLRRMGSDLLVKAIAANTTLRWRKTTRPGKGVSLFSRIQPCYFLKRYKHNIGKSRPLFPKLMMNVWKKLGAFLSKKNIYIKKKLPPGIIEKPGAFLFTYIISSRRLEVCWIPHVFLGSPPKPHLMWMLVKTGFVVNLPTPCFVRTEWTCLLLWLCKMTCFSVCVSV